MDLNDLDGLSELEMYASDPNMVLTNQIQVQTVFGIGKDGAMQDATFHLTFSGKRNDPDNFTDTSVVVSCSVDAAQGLLNTLFRALKDYADAALSEEDEGGE